MASSTMSLRILMVGGLAPWHPQTGGGQIIASKIGEAVSTAGCSVDYVAMAPQENRREVDWGNFIYEDHSSGLLSSFQDAWRSIRRRHLDEYDAVHVHAAQETFGHCLASALHRRRVSRPRFVMSIYSPQVHALPRSLGEVMTAISCRSADLIFALSEFSKNDICRAYGVPQSKVAVTYAGVDSSFLVYDRADARRDDQPYVLLFCGRLNGTEQKGLDVLIRSLQLVTPHHDVVLHIIGAGPRLEEYRSLAETLNVGNHVRFLGFIEHEEMPKYYAEADLFVLPSRRESFGLVLAEAMACGLPVVSTTAGAIPEVVEDGVTGILVPSDDPESLADAINSLLGDTGTRKTMGTRGVETVKMHLTWDGVAQRVIGGYRQVLCSA